MSLRWIGASIATMAACVIAFSGSTSAAENSDWMGNLDDNLYITEVTVSVYNILGQKVATVVNEVKPAGNHTVYWDGMSQSGTPVASGVYFYRIKAGDFVETKKMVLLK
jgi:flagellar hook assembly protein FlgD